RQLRRCSAGIDVNALAVDFDEKRQRFSANPIGRALRWASSALFMSIKRHLAKKPIVGRGQHANFPGPNSPNISRGYRVESFRKSALVWQPPDKIDARPRSNETCVRFRHDNRDIEQMIEMSVSHQDRVHLRCEM